MFSKQNEYEYVTGLGLSSGFVAGGSSGGSASLVASRSLNGKKLKQYLYIFSSFGHFQTELQE